MAKKKAEAENPKPKTGPIEAGASMVHGTKRRSIGNPKPETERVPTGISGLDKMVEGGFERNNSILIKGATGTGKTIFALQYLYEGAAQYDEPGMYLSFAESKEAIQKRGEIFGWDFEELEKKGLFSFARYEPHEVKGIVSSGGGSIRDMIESSRTKRLVIDSLSVYLLLFESEYEANRSVLELFEMLHGMNCTTLVTSENPITPSSSPSGKVGFLTDGIIHIYNIRKGVKKIRALEVVKMRNTLHTTAICGFEITKKGIVVHENSPIRD